MYEQFIQCGCITNECKKEKFLAINKNEKNIRKKESKQNGDDGLSRRHQSMS